MDESIIFTSVQRIFASGVGGREKGEKERKKFGRDRVADPPTNLNPVRSNLAVVGRESGRVNIGAVSFNEPCAPLLFRKRAVAVVSEENDSLPALERLNLCGQPD